MRITILALVLVAFIPTTKVYAWGNEGHRIVCEIAFKLLMPNARKEVRRLLSKIPERDKSAVLDRLDEPANEPFLFNTSCTWPDEVKYGWGYDAMSSWHYVNVPRDVKEVTSLHCSQKCVAYGVNKFFRDLGNKDLDDWERLKALMFLGHFVGDIHQPLHAGFKSDQGGNQTYVSGGPNGCRKMHRIWDTCMIQATGEPWDKIADELLHAYQENPSLEAQAPRPFEWATQSLIKARLEQVQYCHLNGDSCDPIHPEGVNPNYPLDPNYFARNYKIVESQLQLAGLRLAATLNKALE